MTSGNTSSAAARKGRGAAAVERLMRPKSVAIVGISSKPGTAGHAVLNNLTANNFENIHLVGRSGGTIAGRPVLTTIDELPEGVDVAIFTLPASGVKEAVQACIRRKVGGIVLFASGFAEVGERAAQDEIAKIAEEGGIALLGPNCLGYTNFVDGLAVGFTNIGAVKKINPEGDPALAIISQSGGLGSHIRWGLDARDLQCSYSISTGNEAGLDLADFIDYLVEDKLTRVIVVYVEQVRYPEAFLAAAARAHAAGKPILMVHPGRGARAKQAVSSHTGALAGDYPVMKTVVTHAGILLMDTLDELIDTAEILARYPKPVTQGGLAILTFSGAFCALAYDFADDLDIDLPPLTPSVEGALKARLPPFAPPRNPLDLATHALWEPEIVGFGCEQLLADPAMGALLISIPATGPKHSVVYIKGMVEAMKASSKPMVVSMLGDRAPLPAEFVEIAKQNRVILSRSSERSLRAMGHVLEYGKRAARPPARMKATPFSDLPQLGHGTQPEWLGKKLLASIGVNIPAGGLATSADEAVKLAAKVGYPVAMKAQAAALAHKTEAGGVMLGLADEAVVRKAWQTLTDNVTRAQAGLKLDGMLVEKMAPKGVELVIGAKRDAVWGPIVLVGLGGIWVEALGDVRLLPADLSEADIVEELYQLRTAKLLKGFRGQPAVDVEAVARTASAIGRLMLTNPEITEIDINPVFAHPRGQGVTAVDALIVTR